MEQDYENAAKCVNSGGLILLHDVNPTNRSMIGPKHPGSWCGDAYQAWAMIRLASPWYTATLPVDVGVGIVDTTRSAERVIFARPSSFEEFEATRDLILNPITFDQIL